MPPILLALFACQTMEYFYSCDDEVVEELADVDEVSTTLGISVSEAAAWLTRDVEATFETEVIDDEPVQAGLVVSFEPSGPHRVLRRVGDGPCDDGPFLRSEGTATILIEGYAEFAGPATLVTYDADSSALELADPLATVIDEAVDSAFLEAKGPCSHVDYHVGAGSHEAGLSFSSECEVGTEGGFLLRAELQPAEAIE